MMFDCRSYWPTMNPLTAGPSFYHQHQQPVYHHHAAAPVPQQQVDLRSYYYDCSYNTASSSRQMRNQAEKERRDKLNRFINELSVLVPMVSSSPKKLDKTSVLRLSATFLRLSHFSKQSKEIAEIKESVKPDWCHRVLDDMEGMLLVVSSTGKIVYVTENVEKVLRHHQNDLLGQSLYDSTHPEDHIILRHNLKPSEEGGDLSRFPERRSFMMRVKLRAASRSDQQPQYEVIQLQGHLRSPRNSQTQQRSKSHAFERYLKTHLSVTNTSSFSDTKGEGGSNDIFLVALVRLYSLKHVMDNSVLHAYKGEWITRHLLDGTIVNADHRISILSGYLAEEVNGDSGFKYVHEDDVRWVMVALRQMYSSEKKSGWSCYRLRSKNGDLIYLRSEGYIVYDEDDSTSFICINTLVSSDDGEKMIREMKNSFCSFFQEKTNYLGMGPGSSANIKPKITPSPQESAINLQHLKCNDKIVLTTALDMMLFKFHENMPRFSELKNNLRYSNLDIYIKSSSEDEEQPNDKLLPSSQGRFSRPSVITSITGSTDRQKRSQDNSEVLEVKRFRAESRSVIVSDIRSVIRRKEPDTYDLDSSFMFNADLLMNSATSSCLSNFSDDESIMRLTEDVATADIWDASVSDLDDGVVQRHLQLQDKLDSQEAQIEEIEGNLQADSRPKSNIFRNHITNLKNEHRKQQEMLKTLQHDHHFKKLQSIQQVKDDVPIVGAEPDIKA